MHVGPTHSEGAHAGPAHVRIRSGQAPSRPALRFPVGTPKLDVVEGTFEQTYRVGEHHSVALFLALSRKKGFLPYRRARQHEGTLSLRATLSEHDALSARREKNTNS